MGSFNLQYAEQYTKGSFFAHLPLVYDADSQFRIPLLAELDPRTEKVIDLINPELKKAEGSGGYTPAKPEASDYQTPDGAPGGFYWDPINFSTTEMLIGVEPLLVASRINNVLPVGGLQGDDYVWQGGGNIAPYITTIRQDAADSQNNDAFLSGITFGVGGAAAIALVQGLPERISVPRKRLKIPKLRRKASDPVEEPRPDGQSATAPPDHAGSEA